MTAWVLVIVGACLAGLLVTGVRRREPRDRIPVFAVGLFVASLIYVVFAAAGRASFTWLLIELSGLIVFGGLAFAGLRSTWLLLAAGWAAHMAWDAVPHLAMPGGSFAPLWYVMLCLGFDAVIAAYIVWSSLRERGIEPTRGVAMGAGEPPASA